MNGLPSGMAIGIGLPANTLARKPIANSELRAMIRLALCGPHDPGAEVEPNTKGAPGCSSGHCRSSLEPPCAVGGSALTSFA
jgi:hypothetical protein